MCQSTLQIWVIYNSPVDLPGRFVARKWLNDRPTADLLQGKSLEEIRQKLPSGLYCIPRSQGDDPKIVESWI